MKLRTSTEWAALCPQLVIRDPDGWRSDGLAWDKPITWRDFYDRVWRSAIAGYIPGEEPVEVSGE